MLPIHLGTECALYQGRDIKAFPCSIKAQAHDELRIGTVADNLFIVIVNDTITIYVLIKQVTFLRCAESCKWIDFLSVCTYRRIINDFLNALHVFIGLQESFNAQKILRIDAVSFPNKVCTTDSHTPFILAFELVDFVLDEREVGSCTITEFIHTVLPTQSKLYTLVGYGRTVNLWKACCTVHSRCGEVNQDIGRTFIEVIKRSRQFVFEETKVKTKVEYISGFP